MFDPPIGSGADLFIWIVCGVIGVVAALTLSDQASTFQKSKKKEEEEA